LLTATIVGCSGSQRPESEPRRQVASVSVPEPEPEEDEPDASAVMAADAGASETRDAASESASDPELEAAIVATAGDAGMIGILRVADGGGIGFGRIGGIGLSGRGRVTQGSVNVHGGLDKDIIRRIVRRHVPRFRYCYEKELARDPKLTAKAVPKFTIAHDGSVVSASLTPSTGRPTLDACLLAALRTMRFPSFDGGVVVVSYPLIFKTNP
jgi:outer membrane biosynthesis protein TonB